MIAIHYEMAAIYTVGRLYVSVCVCVCACVRVCVCVCVLYVCVCLYVTMWSVCVCVCMWLCVCICIYICVHYYRLVIKYHQLTLQANNYTDPRNSCSSHQLIPETAALVTLKLESLYSIGLFIFSFKLLH